ncbi:MAG: histidine--tRNA ligase [Candidatus Latescibacter sp.]|nr:histidine--tRNA ligase [Candidatus Latescibacter sp.]
MKSMSQEKIKAIKGTNDILPGEVEIWQRIEAVVREKAELYGYSEIRTPIFEETGLFARSIGEDTDIVGKEMYTFRDLGERSLTLRPEGTASVIRAFIEHALDQRGLPQKLWYSGPMFRQERPQKGRQRQFHQFGVEAVGAKSPLMDAEVMILFDDIAGKLGLGERVYLLNSVGGAESRSRYREALVVFLASVQEQLCEDCWRRMLTNPLRVLDCKVPGCRDAIHGSPDVPRTIEYLTESDRAHYGEVKNCLESRGIEFTEDYSLVRGLDYYTGAVFEMQCKGLGAQSTVMGGGRYDNLVKELGGPDMPAVGFACGMERLILAIQAAGVAAVEKKSIPVFIATTRPEHRLTAVTYLSTLRNLGYAADMDYLDRSLKAQMKTASRLQARYVLIVESDGDLVTVRDMELSEQKSMTFEEFIQRVR